MTKAKTKMDRSLFRMADVLEELRDRSEEFPECRFTAECIESFEHILKAVPVLVAALEHVEFWGDSRWMTGISQALAHAKGECPRITSRMRAARAAGLPTDSSREALICWLASQDRNGVWTDEDNLAEYGAVMTLDEAWDQVALMCSEGGE